jgi:hypothetical protein
MALCLERYRPRKDMGENPENPLAYKETHATFLFVTLKEARLEWVAVEEGK